MRSFLTALAIPAATAAALMLSVLYLGPGGPLVALLFNAFLMSEIAGVSQVYRLPMPSTYFRSRRYERRWLYEALGIRMFKRLMRSKAYRAVNPHFMLRDGRQGLRELADRMESAEAAHALLFATVSVVAVAVLFVRWFDAAVWLMLFNVLFNGYPVMLQRYNRLRIQPLVTGATGL